jgi:hypothetical protein
VTSQILRLETEKGEMKLTLKENGLVDFIID